MTKPEDTVVQIILTPVEVKDALVAPDAVPVTATCGHKAWIGPSSMQMVLNPLIRTETRCWRCVSPAELKKSLQKHGNLAAPGTYQEMVATIGQKEADEIYRGFNIRESLPGLP